MRQSLNLNLIVKLTSPLIVRIYTTEVGKDLYTTLHTNLAANAPTTLDAKLKGILHVCAHSGEPNRLTKMHLTS